MNLVHDIPTLIYSIEIGEYNCLDYFLGHDNKVLYLIGYNSIYHIILNIVFKLR